MIKFLIAFILISTNFSSQVKNLTAAKIFINKLENQKFDSAYSFFDTIITSKLSAEMLEQMWGGFTKFMGQYMGYSDLRSENVEGKDSVIIALCKFEKNKLNLSLHFNAINKIDGIYFKPPKNDKSYSAPPYNKFGSFYENKVSVKTNTFELPGILSIPNNLTNPPVVILISGSGPNDKDESIGPNKPFKDLAIGLASNGIASLRYDKRTKVYGNKFYNKKGHYDLYEEYIFDALNAIKLIRNHPATKKSNIYLLGHSLGAVCASKVASKSKDVRGVILFAGPARNFEDIFLEQTQYIFSLDSISAEEKETIESLTKELSLVKNLKALKKINPNELPLNLPFEYWESLSQLINTKITSQLKQPILVLQGGRDYQVTKIDFELWKTALANQTKNQFLFYENLNHLFFNGNKKSVPADYEKQGNVEEKVILDISKWVKEIEAK